MASVEQPIRSRTIRATKCKPAGPYVKCDVLVVLGEDSLLNAWLKTLMSTAIEMEVFENGGVKLQTAL